MATEPGAAGADAFDLNIGKVLEHWTVPFAIREVIANALERLPSAALRSRRLSVTSTAAGTSATSVAAFGMHT